MLLELVLCIKCDFSVTSKIFDIWLALKVMDFAMRLLAYFTSRLCLVLARNDEHGQHQLYSLSSVEVIQVTVLKEKGDVSKPPYTARACLLHRVCSCESCCHHNSNQSLPCNHIRHSSPSRGGFEAVTLDLDDKEARVLLLRS
jgi:hypothetical protein